MIPRFALIWPHTNDFAGPSEGLLSSTHSPCASGSYQPTCPIAHPPAGGPAPISHHGGPDASAGVDHAPEFGCAVSSEVAGVASPQPSRGASLAAIRGDVAMTRSMALLLVGLIYGLLLLLAFKP